MSQANTVVELKALAKSMGLKGYSSLRKAELIEFIQSSTKEEGKSPKKYSPTLIPDISENILSDYIEYDELKELENQIPDLKINPKRITVEETFYDNDEPNGKATYVDGVIVKLEARHKNGKIRSILNYKNGKLDGWQYFFSS